MTQDAIRTPEPAVAGEWVTSIAKRLHDRLEEALKQAYDQGFLTLGASKPAERWRFFVEHTIEADWALIVDPDYLDKRRTGVSPIFEAERVAAEYQMQVANAAANGQPVPPENPYLYPWPVALGQGSASIIYELLASDARTLFRQQIRKAVTA